MYVISAHAYIHGRACDNTLAEMYRYMSQEKAVIYADLNGHRITSRTSVFAPSAHRASPYGDYLTTYYGTNSL